MNPESGSTRASEWVVLAVLARVRGNRGELLAIPAGSRPDRLQALREVWLFGAGARYDVESVWIHDGRPVFKFRGVDSISAAQPLVGAEVRVPLAERAPLAPGEFYQSDLVGCEVVERSTGASLGRVAAWQTSAGSDLLEVRAPDGAELLIPFARSICVEIDPRARRILVDLPEGLKDLNRS